MRSLHSPMRTSGNLATLLCAASVLALSACNKTQPADAFGNFEAEEVVVGSEVSGQLKRFDPLEGHTVAANIAVGIIDTTQLALERDQLVAQKGGLAARRTETNDQIGALEVQREIARRTRERVERLYAGQAATAAQRDQAERDDRVLTQQLSAARAGLPRIASDASALDVRIATVQDRIRRATISNPVAGTVLTTYVRAGEMIQPGQPLYRIANLDTLTLRAYVSGVQLTSFRLGQEVEVKVDAADGALRTYKGVVAWVSSRAEFTPTPVQTRDDRRDLVYAVKVRVANPDGLIKVGMPGDLTLPGAESTPPAKPANKT